VRDLLLKITIASRKLTELAFSLVEHYQVLLLFLGVRVWENAIEKLADGEIELVSVFLILPLYEFSLLLEDSR
jgi:hypothetical protein